MATIQPLHQDLFIPHYVLIFETLKSYEKNNKTNLHTNSSVFSQLQRDRETVRLKQPEIGSTEKSIGKGQGGVAEMEAHQEVTVICPLPELHC